MGFICLNNFLSEGELTETKSIIWASLTDSEKAKVLDQAKAYLLHQIAEAISIKATLLDLDKQA